MRFPISFKIMSLFSFLAAAIIGLLTYNFYEYSYQELENKYGLKLKHIALTGAVGISGEEHDRISVPGHYWTPEFQKIKAHLTKVRDVNGLTNETIYTFKPIDEKKMNFCVMLHPKPFIGNPYDVPRVNQEHIRRVLNGEPASTRIYTDDHGAWISGLAPIKDAQGNVRGILEVDNRVDPFIRELNDKTRNILLVSLVVLLGGLFVSYFFSRAISQPVRRLRRAADAVKSGDYSIRVPVNTHDELADLTTAYNTMADEVDRHTVALENALLENTAILNNMVDGLVALDTTFRIVRHNPAFARLMLEPDADEKLDGRWLSGKFFPETFSLVRASAREDGVVHGEITLAGERVGKATASSLTKTGGEDGATENFGYLVLVRDITQEKEVDRMKTEFISNVSHELRTPLTSVLGFAKLIKRKLDETIFPILDTEEKKVARASRQVEENIGIIVSEGERLTNLINDVLDIAKMEAGKLDWKMAELSINDVVQRAVTATSTLFDGGAVALVTQLGPDLPGVVGDHDRILQVVINLLSNAAKFTDVGAVTVRTSVNENEEIAVSVLDTGPGIPAEDRQKVFEKFKQVGDTLTDKPKGTGLGLPICKQIIEYHGGKIDNEDHKPQGSHFWFTLPIKTSKRIHTEETDLPGLVERLREDNRHIVRYKEKVPRRILIVDDEEPIRMLLRQELESAGYQALEAANGLEALEKVKSEKPHLIILDVMMPKLSGFDTAAILKNDPLMMDIPILILSIVQNRERGLDIGVDSYLNKPINTEDLLGEIRRLLERGVSPKRVMIVDEDEPTLDTLTELLKSRGHTVVPITNGQESIKAAREARPDMIIVGSMLPEGVDIVQTLKFEKDMEHVLFFVLGKKKEGGPA